jgi:hypothetical protein
MTEGRAWSAFEAEVTPGFDVGAHRHREAEELFYILNGELDLLAFEPRIRTTGDWQSWEPASGTRVVRGGPGCTMFVPGAGPHAVPGLPARPEHAYRWMRGSALDVAATVTVATGLTVEEVLRAFETP